MFDILVAWKLTPIQKVAHAGRAATVQQNRTVAAAAGQTISSYRFDQ